MPNRTGRFFQQALMLLLATMSALLSSCSPKYGPKELNKPVYDATRRGLDALEIAKGQATKGGGILYEQVFLEATKAVNDIHNAEPVDSAVSWIASRCVQDIRAVRLDAEILGEAFEAKSKKEVDGAKAKAAKSFTDLNGCLAELRSYIE
jgi:hypothetical protein